MFFSIVELKTTKAPTGNDKIIRPKITDTKDANGIPSACNDLSDFTKFFLV